MKQLDKGRLNYSVLLLKIVIFGPIGQIAETLLCIQKYRLDFDRSKNAALQDA